MPPTITELHKILIAWIHLNDNIISYPPNPIFYILIVVHKLQDLSNSEEWKHLKIRQNCRKDVKKGSKMLVRPKIFNVDMFFFQKDISKDKKNSGVRRCGVHGRVSQLIAYSIHTQFHLWIRQDVKGLIDFTRSGNVSRWGLVCMFMFDGV